MNSSSVRYLVSLMLVICVMLSPNIGACAESVESEPEMEELCVMESIIAAEIVIQEHNVDKLETFHTKHHIFHKQMTSREQSMGRNLTKEYCVFRE